MSLVSPSSFERGFENGIAYAIANNLTTGAETMTYSPTQDRSYWRMQDDARLIDEAKYNPGVELCIALGERLAILCGSVEEIEDLSDECEELRIRIDQQRQELVALKQEIDGLEG